MNTHIKERRYSAISPQDSILDQLHRVSVVKMKAAKQQLSSQSQQQQSHHHTLHATNNSSPVNKGHHGESATSIQLQPISHSTVQQGHLSQNRHTNMHSNNNGSNNCGVNSVASNGKNAVLQLYECTFESLGWWISRERKITATP